MTVKEKLLAAVAEEPGVTMLELVERTGLREGQVWKGMSALAQSGEVKRFDRGWKVTGRGDQ